jgi:hypothetical protein
MASGSTALVTAPVIGLGGIEEHRPGGESAQRNPGRQHGSVRMMLVTISSPVRRYALSMDIRAADPAQLGRSANSRPSRLAGCALVLVLLCLCLYAPALAAADYSGRYDHWGANLTVVMTTLLLVVACILLHYIGLDQTWAWLDHRRGARRHRRVLYGLLAALMLHISQIWLFGIGYWLLAMWPATGHVQGAQPLGLFDAVYLSAASFTTVGFGDLTPIGALRFMSGTESLIGFMLITWSASFTFLEMDRYWRRRD